MTTREKIFALQNLRFRWHTCTSVAFQDVFTDLMENAWPQDFQKVRPYGPYGDLKCDGWWESRRCLFQCYGPERMKETEVIAKMDTDLRGAVEHWKHEMKAWAFVHNDQKGLTGHTLQAMRDLRKEFPSIEIKEWKWPQAREQFDRLSSQAIVELYGYPPTLSSETEMSFEELRPIVEAISRKKPDLLIPLTHPPTVMKLEKNLLDDDSAEFLRVGRRRVRVVEEYFEQHYDPDLGDQIAKAMQIQYMSLRDSGLDPNETLIELQRFAGWGKAETSIHHAAVLAVITYFFDRCDIFEDPDSNTANLGRESV